MPSSSSQSRIDRNTYIPPHIQQAMTQHMQQSMPAHLKKYVGSNAAYVPRHMESAVAQQMQKNMPAHLKQYAGAYMQQQVIQPNTSRLHATPQRTTTLTPRAPMPDKLRRGHSMPSGEQHTVELNTLPEDRSLFQAEPAPPSDESEPHHPTYDFIMNPEQPPKKSFLTAGSSMAMRALLLTGVFFVLVVGFVMVKSLLGGSSAVPAFLSIAQDQQELIHLVTDASEQQDLSTDNKNFAATAQLSLSSSQSDIVKYLQANGKKINVKQLNLKISAQTDSRLATAAAASTYNQTFQEIMKIKLTDYISGLQQTHQESKGQKGRILLNDSYNQAQLLLSQLNAAATSSQ